MTVKRQIVSANTMEPSRFVLALYYTILATPSPSFWIQNSSITVIDMPIWHANIG
jgi:hypothetical protein